MQKTAGLFGEEYKLEKISKLGDSLEMLNKVIDCEIFGYILNKLLVE